MPETSVYLPVCHRGIIIKIVLGMLIACVPDYQLSELSVAVVPIISVLKGLAKLKFSNL